jgi:hypothetical protein
LTRLVGTVAAIVAFAAWFTHIAACVDAGDWVFLVIGALLFPVGIVHGAGLWLGVFAA